MFILKIEGGIKVFSNLIFVLNGPSAGGKTMVLEALLEKNLGLEKLVTVTTRKPRTSPVKEVHGEDYYFITKEEFLKMKENTNEDQIVEETEYPKGSGVLYGIFDSEIERIGRLGKDAVVILDIHGISEMKRFYGDSNVVSIFINMDIREIEKSLGERDISEDELRKRLAFAREEYKNIEKTDYVVNNDSTKDDLLNQVIRIINKERMKKNRRGA